MPHELEAEKYVEPEERKSGKFDEYELDGALRTLKQAEKIKANSHLLKALKGHLKDQKRVISSLEELKEVAEAKFDEEDSGEEA